MESRSQHYFFIGLLIGALVLVALIFLPYMAAIVIAIVLSVIFRPLHKWVAKIVAKGNQRNTFATIISLLLIAILVLTPASFLLVRLYSESQNLYVSLTNEEERSMIITTLNTALQSFSHTFFDISPNFNFDSFNVTSYIQNIFKWAFSNLNTLFSSAAAIGLNIFVILLVLYYMLRDGGALKRQLIAFSPLLEVHEEQILVKLTQAIRSVITGSLIVSMIQGVLSGIGFSLFGVPNPVLWGTVAMIAALIPGIGTAMVMVPVVLYLFFFSSHLMALGMVVWAVLAVGLIDNMLAGVLINRGVHIHPVLILLSVLGGLSFFGPIGFILGPLALAFLFALIEIYKKQL